METFRLIQQLTLLLDTYNYVGEDGELVTRDQYKFLCGYL